MKIENSHKINNTHLIWGLLVLIWAIIQTVLYHQSGIKTGYDSAFYLYHAKELLSFDFPVGRGIWYMGYITFLAIFLGIGFSLEHIIFLQITLSLIALISLYKSAKTISGNKETGFITAALYIFWIPLQEWNVFLYTESLFTSCLIISFCLLLRVKTLKELLLLFPFLLFTCSIRPTGLGFFFALSAYLASLILQKSKFKGYRQVVAIALFSLSLILIIFMLESYELIESYAKAEIIYPNISLGVTPPDDLIIPDDDQFNVFQLFYFVLYNPIYFFKLCIIKLFLFFGNIKPYFSLLHNLYILLLLYPIYIFAYRGYRKLQNPPIKLFFSVYILVQGLTIMLTTENWDGRFLVPVLPFIFVLASIDINRIFISLKPLRTDNKI